MRSVGATTLVLLLALCLLPACSGGGPGATDAASAELDAPTPGDPAEDAPAVAPEPGVEVAPSDQLPRDDAGTGADTTEIAPDAPPADDGGGGGCGPCGGGRCVEGSCEPLCLPDCGSRTCGHDGCGGSCGLCAPGSFCEPAGACDQPPLPTAWACAPNRWSDGTACDCQCGQLDPDCASSLGLPVLGCEAGQSCTPGGACAASLPRWTLLFYLSGDNNLEFFVQDDLAELGVVGAHPDVQVLVLADTRAGPAQTLRVVNGGLEVLQENGELDLSDWRVLRDFGLFGVQSFPAEHYALILSNHGSGWRAGGKAAPLKGVSNDNSGSSYEISVAKGDLARALSGLTLAVGRPLDVLGFDACIMGTWEVATAVAPYATWMVGSEETEPGPGWTFGPALAALGAEPASDPLAVATLFAETYHAKSLANATISVVDTHRLGALSDALSGLALRLFAEPSSYDVLDAARQAALGFAVNDDTGETSLRDLGDLARRLAAAPELSTSIREQAQQVVDRLRDAVVVSKNQAPDYAAATGLSIYLPAPDECRNHLYELGSGATWSQTATWDDLLADFNAFDCGAWVCNGEWFGGGDGCDCNCGAWDPDCDLSLADVFHCLPGQLCEPPGLCSGEAIPLCPTWTCTPSFFGGNDGCDCDCGCPDPDCADPSEKLLNCQPGQHCDAAGLCAGEPLVPCEGWACEPDFYGAADGCDCACGCWDPDCDLPGTPIWHCDDGQTCAPPLGTCQ